MTALTGLLTSAASNASVLAAIEFRPQIAGVLTVLIGVIVLMGSIWLILSTNSGIRIGTLLSLAGFFGWMFIMGVFWWIYGIGYAGSAPVWVTGDINRGDLQSAGLEEARQLAGVEDLSFTAYDLVINGDNDEAIAEYATMASLRDTVEIPDVIRDETTQALYPNQLFENLDREDQDRVTIAAREAAWDALTPERKASLEEDFAAFAADRQLRNETVTFSEVASVATELIDEANFVPGDWRLLSAAQAGEAQAQASSDLLDNGFFGAASEFKFLDAYDRGGKPKRDIAPDAGWIEEHWERAKHKISSIINFRHPVHHAVVQVQAVVDAEPLPGEAPPRPVVDENEPVISVIMTRDLGNVRFPPFMIALGSLIIFLVLCYLLHVRDADVAERRKAFEAEKARV